MKFNYNPFTGKVVFKEQTSGWPAGVGLNKKTAENISSFVTSKNINLTPEREEELGRGLVRGGFGNLANMMSGRPDVTTGQFETTPQEHNLGSRLVNLYRKIRDRQQRQGAITNPGRMLPAPTSSSSPVADSSSSQASSSSAQPSTPPAEEAPPSPEEMAQARAHWSGQRQIGRQVRKGWDQYFQGLLNRGETPGARIREIASRVRSAPALTDQSASTPQRILPAPQRVVR